jgi:hypothetical protein
MLHVSPADQISSEQIRPKQAEVYLLENNAYVLRRVAYILENFSDERRVQLKCLVIENINILEGSVDYETHQED